MRKEIRKDVKISIISMLVISMLISSTLSLVAYAAPNNTKQSDVTINFEAGAQKPINVYKPKDGKKDHTITPPNDVYQVLVYAYPIPFGTWKTPTGEGKGEFWAEPGIIGVQATDIRDAGTSGWSITAQLSKFKRNSAEVFPGGATLELLNGGLLKGEARDRVDGTDEVCSVVNLETSSIIAMGNGTQKTDIKLVAGTGESNIARTIGTIANQPWAWIMRWEESQNAGGQGNIKLTVTDRTDISDGPYNATITWLFKNTP